MTETSGLYTEEQGTNPSYATRSAVQSGALTSDNNFLGGIGDLDASTAAYMKQTEKVLSTPVPEALKNEAYYPDANSDINVGTYSGNIIGSVPIFAATGGLFPQAIVDAKRRAQQEYLKKQQLEWGNAQVEYATIKDDLKNNIFIDEQSKFWNNFYAENMPKYKKAYGNPLLARKMLVGSTEAKTAALKYKMLANGYDEVFDFSTKITHDPDVANNYSPAVRKMASEFLNTSFTSGAEFDPNKTDKLLSIQRGLTARLNLAKYSTSVAELALSDQATLNNLVKRTSKKIGVQNGYDVWDDVYEVNQEKLKEVIDGAITTYENKGQQLTAEEKADVKFYLDTALDKQIREEKVFQANNNLGWAHYASGEKDKAAKVVGGTDDTDIVSGKTEKKYDLTSAARGGKPIVTSITTGYKAPIIISYVDRQGNPKTTTVQGVQLPPSAGYVINSYTEGEADKKVGGNIYVSNPELDAQFKSMYKPSQFAPDANDEKPITIMAKVPLSIGKTAIDASGVVIKSDYYGNMIPASNQTPNKSSNASVETKALGKKNAYVETKALGKKSDGTWVVIQ